MSAFKTAFDKINERIQTAIRNDTCRIQLNNMEYKVNKFDWFASDTNFEIYFEDHLYDLNQAGVLIVEKTVSLVTMFDRKKFEVAFYLNSKMVVTVTGVYQLLDNE